jgi:hypothetical protein
MVEYILRQMLGQRYIDIAIGHDLCHSRNILALPGPEAPVATHSDGGSKGDPVSIIRSFKDARNC